jgi:hypothetical protein
MAFLAALASRASLLRLSVDCSLRCRSLLSAKHLALSLPHVRFTQMEALPDILAFLFWSFVALCMAL